MPLGAVARKGPREPGDRFMTESESGHVDASICAACGFTELYWQKVDALRHNPADGMNPEQSQEQRARSVDDATPARLRHLTRVARDVGG